MNKQNGPQQGGCRCDQVRFNVTAPPFMTALCHCTGCQRMTGSAFSLTAAFPANAFTITKGEPVIGGLHGSTLHYFCPHCMSWVFTRPNGFDFVNVRTTMLDDPSGFAPFIETYTSEKLPWVTTPAPYKFEKFPAVDEFKGLMRKYAQWVASP